jgi:predicted nucleic acid-binding protein
MAQTRVIPKLHSSLRLAAETSKPVFLTATDYTRMAVLAESYRNLPLGTTDASLVAPVERLNLSEVATLDRRHFTVVRPRHVGALQLLP